MSRFFSFLFFILLLTSCGNSSNQSVNIKDVGAEQNGTRMTQLGNITSDTQIYLRGSFNKWDVSTPFTRVGDGVYVIENITLFNGRDGFKIANEDWSIADIGGNGSALPHDSIYSVTVGGGNIFIEGLKDNQTMVFSQITLDINKMQLVMTKDPVSHPHISLDYADDTEFMTDMFDITVSFNLDVTNGFLKVISPAGSQMFTVEDNEKVSIGKDVPFNSTITVVAIANADDHNTDADTTRFVKSEPTGVYVYYSNPTNWKQPYCYLWSLRGDQNFPWPGEKMTWDDKKVINGKRGWWKTHVSRRYADFGEVIFNNNDGLQTNDDLSMEGGSMYYDGLQWASANL